MRLFLSVDVPENIRDNIFSLCNNFSGRIKLVEKHNLHITLHFFGDSDPDKVLKALEGFSFSPFTVMLDRLSIEKKRHYDLIIVRLSSDGLVKLNKDIVDRLGIPNGRFKPHITLGRAKRLDSYKIMSLEGSFEVSSFSLMQSRLTPTGPIYKEIQKYKSG